MRSKKMMLAVLLCVALILGLAACGEKTDDRQSNAGANAGGDVTQNGGNEDNNGDNNGENNGDNAGGEATIDPTKKPFEPGDGDSLKEFAGLWGQDRGNGVYASYYIHEDGTWGVATFEGDEPRGIVKYENGKFSFAEGEGDWWSVEEFTVDKDGNLVDPDGYLWCRYSAFYPQIEALGKEYVGYWKLEDYEYWLSIDGDATWKAIDSDGKTVGNGYIGGRAEREEYIFMICDDGSMPAITLISSDEELYGDLSLIRTVSIPGIDRISPLYAGVWKFSELDIMVHVREDYTWASYSPYQELIAEGTLEPNTEGYTITLAVDGKNEMTYEQYDVGALYGDGDGDLDRLDTTTDAGLAIDEKFLGIWQFDWLRQYITIKEDGTWTAEDYKGNIVNGGTVVVKESLQLCGYSEDTQVIILMPDEEGYPLVLSCPYSEVDQMASKEWHNSAKRLEEIPATAKYAGTYLWEAQERYIRIGVDGSLTATYHLDGTFWDTSSNYNVITETGELSMRLYGSDEVLLVPMADGGWADAEGNPQIVPVSLIPSVDPWAWGNWGILPIEDVWYYAAKDVYLSFGYDASGFDGPEGDCLVMDENGKDIGRGEITYGMEAIYTVTAEDAGLNVVLTLDQDGRLTDAEGNELVKAHNMKYRN